jgi:hypothetical protein
MVSRNAKGTARSALPRWVFVVLAAVLVLAAVVGVSLWYQNRPAAPVTTSTPVSSTVPVAADGGDIPNGCLAGTSLSGEALLAAQKKAPHTQAGAVGLAAAFTRWGWQYPYPALADVQSVAEAFASSDDDPSIKNMATRLSTAQARSGWVSGGLSFAEGRYLVEEASADRVKVTVGGDQIKNGLPVPDTKGLTTITLLWADGGWKIQGIKPDMTTDDLFARGAALAGGC